MGSEKVSSSGGSGEELSGSGGGDGTKSLDSEVSASDPKGSGVGGCGEGDGESEEMDSGTSICLRDGRGSRIVAAHLTSCACCLPAMVNLR